MQPRFHIWDCMGPQSLTFCWSVWCNYPNNQYNYYALLWDGRVGLWRNHWHCHHKMWHKDYLSLTRNAYLWVTRNWNDVFVCLGGLQVTETDVECHWLCPHPTSSSLPCSALLTPSSSLLNICKLWTGDTIRCVRWILEIHPKCMFCFECFSFCFWNPWLRVAGWQFRRKMYSLDAVISSTCLPAVWRPGLRHWFIRAGWTWTESKVARNSQEVCKVREKETKPTHEIIELRPCSNSQSLRKENILGPRREAATKNEAESPQLWFVVSNCLRFVQSPCRISDTEQCNVMVINERDSIINNKRKRMKSSPFWHVLADSCGYFNVLISEMVRCCFVDTDPDAHGRQIIRLGLIPPASPPLCPDQTLP